MIYRIPSRIKYKLCVKPMQNRRIFIAQKRIYFSILIKAEIIKRKKYAY